MAYSEKVIDHYENPRNVGSFDNNDENVGSGMVGAPALSLIHISEPTRREWLSRMPSSA